MQPARKPYLSDVSYDEWSFILPYLNLMREDSPQRTHLLQDCFEALQCLVKTGFQRRWHPHDFPPWVAVYQRTRRWEKAGFFEEVAQDLASLVRRLEECRETPSAAIFDGRML